MKWKGELDFLDLVWKNSRTSDKLLDKKFGGLLVMMRRVIPDKAYCSIKERPAWNAARCGRSGSIEKASSNTRSSNRLTRYIISHLAKLESTAP